METIYERARDYDLEHEGDDEDVRFYQALLERLRPRRVLELASGSGRVTLPLAQFSATAGLDCAIVGLERSEAMLGEAERKLADSDAAVRRRVSFVRADMRDWRADRPFDLIVTPCSSLSHLLALEDQLAAWSRAHDNLVPGGRFVVDLTMPNLAAFAESMQTPPRTVLEVDVDTQDPCTGERLIRYKTTRYFPDQQRADVRFLYDKFVEGNRIEHYVSDFASHVYFPREIELLFRVAGFTVESRYGDYRMRAPRPTSRQLIVTGRR
jgi:SAM-dependent methyltransferase